MATFGSFFPSIHLQQIGKKNLFSSFITLEFVDVLVMSRRSLSSPSARLYFISPVCFCIRRTRTVLPGVGEAREKLFLSFFSGNVNCSQSAAPFPPLVARYSRHMHFLPPPPSLPRLLGHETWKVSKFGHLVSLQHFCGNSRFCGEKSWDPSSRPPKQSRRISVRKMSKKVALIAPSKRAGFGQQKVKKQGGRLVGWSLPPFQRGFVHRSCR